MVDWSMREIMDLRIMIDVMGVVAHDGANARSGLD